MEFFLTENPEKGLQLSASIAAALQQAMSQGNLRQTAQFRTIRAMGLALAGWRREAMETLRDTLHDTKHLGYVRSFLDRGPVIIDLLHDYRENPEEGANPDHPQTSTYHPAPPGRMMFDVVIIDLKMEGVDGFGVIKAAKEFAPLASIIVITGTGHTALDADDLGVEGILKKPFDSDQLISRIESCLLKQDLPMQQIKQTREK